MNNWKFNEFKEIKSICEPYFFSNFDQFKKDIHDLRYVLIYQLNQVKTIRIEDIALDHFNDLLEIRAFSEKKEIRLVNVSGQFIGRTRIDGEGSDIEVLDEAHLIWGSVSSSNELAQGYSLLTSEKGTYITLPLEIEAGYSAFVTVRNYLSTDSNVFEFNDFRLMELFVGKIKDKGRSEKIMSEVSNVSLGGQK